MIQCLLLPQEAVDRLRQLFAIVESNGYTTALRLRKEIEGNGIRVYDFRMSGNIEKSDVLG